MGGQEAVISDVEARGLAEVFALSGDSALARLARNGEITPDLASSLRRFSPSGLKGLRDYVVFHGPREAVDGWRDLPADVVVDDARPRVWVERDDLGDARKTVVRCGRSGCVVTSIGAQGAFLMVCGSDTHPLDANPRRFTLEALVELRDELSRLIDAGEGS